MRNRVNTKSLSFQIWICMIGLVLGLVSVVFVLSYYMTLRTTEENAVESTTQLVTAVGSQISSYLEYMENISDFMVADPDIRNYLNDTSKDQMLYHQAREKLSITSGIRSDISNVVLFKTDGTYLLGKEYIKFNEAADYRQSGWYREAVAARGNPVISSSHVQNVIRDDYRWVISFSRAVFDSAGTLQGVLLIDLKYNVIRRLCEDIRLGKSGYVFILDETGDLVYHPYQQLIYSNLKKEPISEIFSSDQDVFTVPGMYGAGNYTVSVLPGSGWRIVGAYNARELLQNKKTVALAYFYVFMLFLGIGIFFSVMLSSRLTKPVKRLIQGMRRIENNDFTGEVNILAEDEIGQLARVFNHMIERLNRQRKQNRRDMEEKRKSEIRALQAQINPHFLYNTLDSIVWMAETGHSDEVIEMTMALSHLFRASISKNDEFVPLAMEVEHVRSYLIIQKIRYQDQLNFEIHVPAALMDYRVIKLFLQPLVENAIYHGIKEKPGPGMIIVSGCDAGMDLILTVEDDGVGMDQHTLQNILKPKDRTSGGIGIVNVNQRIKLYYGQSYGLRYTSEKGKGTRVQIQLPKEEV